jgi:hypothetical protein
MERVFLCIQGGRKLFSIRRQGQEIFVGSPAECDRFLEIHARKVAEERAEDQRPQRARPFVVRRYRQPRIA